MSAGFEPLRPRDLGHVVDVVPKAEERALSMVELRIKELEDALDEQRRLNARLSAKTEARPVAWARPSDIAAVAGNYDSKVSLNCERSEYHGFTIALHTAQLPQQESQLLVVAEKAVETLRVIADGGQYGKLTKLMAELDAAIAASKGGAA